MSREPDSRREAPFPADCHATGIGSFPFREPEPALDAILAHLPEIPMWPQLPARSFREGFFTQFAAALPAVRLDERSERLHIDTGDAGLHELAPFYERVLAEDLSAFALPESHATGFHRFLARLAIEDVPRLAVKGQISGPISFGLGLADPDGRAILHNETFFEAVRASLRLQAAWQIEALRPHGGRVILFLDEPHLATIGSAFTQLAPAQATAWIDEIVDEVHRRGALAGVHCCGNTDWPILFRSRLDIISFDAFGFFDSFSLYPDALRAFLARGGLLACGIVPTQETTPSAGAEELAERLLAGLGRLDSGLSPRELGRRMLITPACGLGTCSEEFSLRAMAITAQVSAILRERFGFDRERPGSSDF